MDDKYEVVNLDVMLDKMNIMSKVVDRRMRELGWGMIDSCV